MPWFFRVVRRRRRHRTPAPGQTLYKLHKETARVCVERKLAEWNELFGFRYGRVAIRNSKTRWGSCSRAGNLNFNYKVIFLPEKLFDYVIVHELAHLAEFNHSPAFWQTVARAIPDWHARRNALRKHRIVVPRKPLEPDIITPPHPRPLPASAVSSSMSA